MSRLPSEPHLAAVALGHRVTTAWRPWRRRARLMLTDLGLWDIDSQRLVADVPAWCQANAGCAVDVWAAGCTVHHLVCRPDLPLHDSTAVVGYAKQLFTHYYGLPAQQWPMAPWRSGSVRGACALHGMAGGGLREAAVHHCVLVRSMRPLWAAALQWALRYNKALAKHAKACVVLVEGALITWIDIDCGRCVDLRTSRLAAATMADLLVALAVSERADQRTTVVLGYGLRGEVTGVKGWTVLGRLDAAGAPVAWFRSLAFGAKLRGLPVPEFTSGTTQRPPALAWVSLVCAGAVLATAALQAQANWQALRNAESMLQVGADAGPGDAEIPLVKPKAVPMSAADAVALATALHRPWGHWLAATEAAAGANIKWLELEHDAAAGNTWRLKGQARDGAAALQAASSLSASAGWRGAQAMRLHPAEPGAPVVFEINGRAPTLAAVSP